jgi:hypothetical protein
MKADYSCAPLVGGFAGLPGGATAVAAAPACSAAFAVSDSTGKTLHLTRILTAFPAELIGAGTPPFMMPVLSSSCHSDVPKCAAKEGEGDAGAERVNLMGRRSPGEQREGTARERRSMYQCTIKYVHNM